MSIAILPMSKEFNWNSATVGLIQSSFFWGYLLTQIVGGIWADKVGGKLVLGFGGEGGSAGEDEGRGGGGIPTDQKEEVVGGGPVILESANNSIGDLVKIFGELLFGFAISTGMVNILNLRLSMPNGITRISAIHINAFGLQKNLVYSIAVTDFIQDGKGLGRDIG